MTHAPTGLTRAVLLQTGASIIAAAVQSVTILGVAYFVMRCITLMFVAHCDIRQTTEPTIIVPSPPMEQDTPPCFDATTQIRVFSVSREASRAEAMI